MTPTTQLLIPSVEKLQQLINAGCADIAMNAISQYKLPYRIDGGVIKDSLTQTERWLKEFITLDPELVAMKDDIHKLAKCPDEVMITGETGTGKEIIARALRGDRVGKFAAVNCAGLPEGLIESELFGHVKGAFTGAVTEKVGLLEYATEGLAFLDEIAELPLHTQGKLLRVIQERRIRKVGSNNETDMTCKIVCATKQPIRKMVEEGKFRDDLYARLSTFELHVKPLRDRECDIIPIIQSLDGGEKFLASNPAIHKLDLRYNVRSLQQYVKRYNVLGRTVI